MHETKSGTTRIAWIAAPVLVVAALVAVTMSTSVSSSTSSYQSAPDWYDVMSTKSTPQHA